jgi:hypothetical protein
VYAFTATIDNRRLQGVIRDREAARAEYEIAVSYGENAALLQQENVESRLRCSALSACFEFVC